ncbi:tetratricopeptide repeat-containing sensor histidine kinase [Flavipsychrobacter stenotrophus]|nr:HAMP domain-containing sensor histidine kinase [Flavipsychrobacter stenotrophus]
MKLRNIPLYFQILLLLLSLPALCFGDDKVHEGKIAVYKQAIEKAKNTANDSSVYYAEQGLLYSLSNHYIEGQAEMLMALALIDREQGRYEQAKQRALFIIGLYRELHDLRNIALVQNFIGTLEAARKNDLAAIEYYATALELYDTIVTDHAGRMLTYMNLGKLYLQNSDVATAQMYLMGAEDLAKKVPVSDTTIALNNCLAELYLAKNKDEEALKYLQRNIILSDVPELINAHAQSLYSLGVYYNERGDASKAIDCWNRAMSIARRQNLYAMQINILLNAAEIALPQYANEYLDEAMGICNKMHNPATRARLFGELAIMYERQGKYMNAVYASKMQTKIIDSIDRINREKEFKENNTTRLLLKSNSRVRQLESLSHRNAVQSTIITIVSIALIIALTTMIVMYSRTKKLNKKLVKHEGELSELNSTKNKLFSIIGHDLRAPLARIYMVLDLYDQNIFDENEKKEIFQQLKTDTKATSETLDKLLFWGQSLMKGTSLQQLPFEARPFVQQNVDFKHSATVDKSIAVRNNIPEGLTVYADYTHFDFIVRNLLANAIKFTYENGTIEINADETMLKDMVVFSVKDNGTGIPLEQLKRIFEPFHSTEGTANEKGTGMGLMLCKEFAIKNGGDLWVESTVGKGTTFFFSMPKAAGDK